MSEPICERDVELHLMQRIVGERGEIRKVKWIGRANAPDRRVMLYPFPVWVELKRPGKRATNAQLREHNRMRLNGERVTVVCSKEGVDEMLAHLKRNGNVLHLYP